MNIEVNKKAPAFHEAELLVHASAQSVIVNQCLSNVTKRGFQSFDRWTGS
ncbi:hypothetical protein [uncultured Sunxiuqinia sp.]|nr:hypothetical protein [uncultured Sunxiuqinia sp.]